MLGERYSTERITPEERIARSSERMAVEGDAEARARERGRGKVSVSERWWLKTGKNPARVRVWMDDGSWAVKMGPGRWDVIAVDGEQREARYVLTGAEMDDVMLRVAEKGLKYRLTGDTSGGEQ